MAVLRSRDNPRLRRWNRLVSDARERRREGRAVIEGAHLVRAFLDAGGVPEALILSESGADGAEIAQLARRAQAPATVLSDKLFDGLADTESAAGIAAEIGLPQAKPELGSAAGCVFLEAVQDAGNVGAILRSAAAFGIPVAVLGPGCADAWSPKVLRAAMGAHFSVAVVQSAELEGAIGAFGGRTACTAPRAGTALADADLGGRIGWMFGAEGQGVSKALAARSTLKVSIPMAATTESLNVAAAAAICFYQWSMNNRRTT